MIRHGLAIAFGLGLFGLLACGGRSPFSSYAPTDGGADAAGGGGSIGPCTMNGQPCTYQACVDRCTQARIGGWADLRASGKRCACSVPATCRLVCENSICTGALPESGSACERCMVQLAVRPPDECGIKVCDPGGACSSRTLCELKAGDCEELVACLRECPAP
ncbi:MAG: hypothetical protein ABW133_13235 [Polyangiaceae bacterium]